jgi:bacteriorhodopsin
MLMLILTLALIVALVGALPTWPHSKNWGYYPIGGVSLVILIVLVLLLTDRL